MAAGDGGGSGRCEAAAPAERELSPAGPGQPARCASVPAGAAEHGCPAPAPISRLLPRLPGCCPGCPAPVGAALSLPVSPGPQGARSSGPEPTDAPVLRRSVGGLRSRVERVAGRLVTEVRTGLGCVKPQKNLFAWKSVFV